MSLPTAQTKLRKTKQIDLFVYRYLISVFFGPYTHHHHAMHDACMHRSQMTDTRYLDLIYFGVIPLAGSGSRLRIFRCQPSYVAAPAQQYS